MLQKAEVIKAIKKLPEQFSIDDLVERLIVLQKIHTGLEQVAEGNTVSTEKAKEKLNKWLK